MIRILVNREKFEYNSYALIVSFYPGVETRQAVGEPADFFREPADTIGIFGNDTEDGGEVYFGKGEILSRDEKYTYHKAPEHEFKQGWKLFLYDVLVKYTGRTLPWGALSGVRPTKLIMAKLRELPDPSDLKDWMYKEYRVSEEKIALGEDIAGREDELLRPFRDGKGMSVYIGIPFCPTRCLYCSFTAYSIGAFEKKVEAYLQALRTEIRKAAEILKGHRLDTVYIGGGTPTSLSAEQLEQLLAMAGEELPLEQAAEFTVEAGRPDSITPAKLQIMKKYGVGRISVNPQTFKEETLELIGRRHTTEQVRSAFVMAREEGFDNINMDLILGLPGEDLSDVKHTLRCVEELKPDSLTVHSLAVKRASRMKEWIREHGAISGLDHENAMKAAQESAARMGMAPYYLYRQKNMAGNLENTGFATPGHYGLYNILIMEEVQSIIACGAGTVSKRVDGDGTIERCDTYKELDMYIREIDEMCRRKERLFYGNEIRS